MAEKEIFQYKIEKQLQEWKVQINEHMMRIEEFKAKAEQLETDAQLQYLEQIRKLEKRIDAVKDKIVEGEQKLDSLKTQEKRHGTK